MGRSTKEEILDTIQARYHRPIAECLAMPFSRLKAIWKIQQEEYKEKLILNAFIAHQLGAGGQKTFGEYLYQLGLGSKPPEAKTLTTEEIKAKSKSIRERALRSKHV